MAHLLLQNLRVIAIWALVLAAVSAGISLIFPRYYAAESTVLVISRDRSISDPYVQSKSGELIGAQLSRVIQTDDFFNKVMEQGGVSFNKDVWQNLSARKQRRLWAQNVRADVVYGTSLLTVKAFSRTQDDAVKFASAVTQTAVSRGWEYIGGDIVFKVVNNPAPAPWQARPNILLNMLIGLFVGAVLSIVWILRYKKHALLAHL